MSYILDALKKSERQRGAGAVPRLRTAPRIEADRRRLWWLAGIGGVVLVSAAVAAWQAGPGLLQQVRHTLQVPAASDNGAGTRSAKPATATAERSEPGGETAATRDTARSAAAAGHRAGLDALTPAARARIKELSVNVVSYSEVPERRFVMLNQRIAHESDTVADGVVVQRITRKGVVLAVEGEEVLLRPQ